MTEPPSGAVGSDPLVRRLGDPRPCRLFGTRRAPYAGVVAGRILLCLFALLLLACAPTYHRASPYRFDHAAAAAIETKARDRCRDLGFPAGEPTERFRTDGCSMWPDGMFTGETWQRCCVEHDMAYWCGGTRAMRKDADRELRECVGREYRSWMGAVMYPGVYLGGAPHVPAYWRWGYGHRYPKGYSDPTD